MGQGTMKNVCISVMAVHKENYIKKKPGRREDETFQIMFASLMKDLNT